MKLSNVLTATCVAALIGVMGFTSFAESATASDTADATAASENSSTQIEEKAAPELTEEQKAEMETRKVQMDASQKAWEALTDAQKEEIYALEDEKSAIDSKIIDKYLEFGVVDAQTAEEFKTRTSEEKTKMRENGRMPMFGGKGMGGGRGPCGTPPDATSEKVETETETEATTEESN